jgi:putative transcriptional regulator
VLAAVRDNDQMSTTSLVGQLLVATPALADPNFARAVVLILQHDDDGALGVVVNRATSVPVGDVLPSWEDLATAPPVLFHGGPVSRNSALGLARVAAADKEPIGWRRLEGPVGLVDLDTPTELISGGLGDLRIFAGYAGWAAGQLEAEIDSGSWFVVDALPGDAFVTRPADLWRSVLRRQPGELAMVSTFPDDPTMN